MPLVSVSSFSVRRRGCLLALGALATGRPVLAAGPSRGTGAGVLLARDAPADLDPAGWLVSEKFDGVRALWDGHALRFRSGRPLPAPASLVAALPREPLDGELWIGRGRFDELSALLRREAVDEATWAPVRYLVFEQPGGAARFDSRSRRLRELVAQARCPALAAVEQQVLPDRTALRRRFEEVVRGGGEGLMLHRADAAWVPGRSDTLLKMKPLRDADAVVLGHVAGRGRHAGRLGALRVRNEGGVVFLLGSGFSDAQRETPPRVGATVTYAYRGLTPGGVPRFATFLRARGPDA